MEKEIFNKFYLHLTSVCETALVTEDAARVISSAVAIEKILSMKTIRRRLQGATTTRKKRAVSPTFSKGSVILKLLLEEVGVMKELGPATGKKLKIFTALLLDRIRSDKTRFVTDNGPRLLTAREYTTFSPTHTTGGPLLLTTKVVSSEGGGGGGGGGGVMGVKVRVIVPFPIRTPV